MNKLIIMAVTVGLASLIYAQSNASAGTNGGQGFLKKASEANTFEIELGRLAQKNASSEAVKKFGERMVTDHSKLEQQTRSVATATGTALPSGAGTENRAEYTRLAAKMGSDFDKAYISLMIKDHEHDIAAFQNEANSGTNPEIKSMASEALPTLNEHLRLAQTTAKEIGLSSTGF